MAMNLVLFYLAAVNVVAFVMMAYDKRQAKRSAWRVPEKTLLGTAVIGGSAGVYAGMRMFRHKTKHWIFSLGVPVIMAAQVAAVYAFLR